MTTITKPAETPTAAEILLKLLEQLEPIESEQDRRIRAAISSAANESPAEISTNVP
jgi:hypothetical protein